MTKRLLIALLALSTQTLLADNVEVINPVSRPVPVTVVAGGGGGGGGPVTVASGADVTEGSTTDARTTATDVTSATVMAVLKEISFMEQNPATQPVTLAANQSVNVAQIAGATPQLGNGTNAGAQRVTIASDSSYNPGVAQGSTTSGQVGPLVQGAVASGVPVYTAGQTDPLSLTPGGALRTDLTSTAGTTLAVNTGNPSAGTLRVALSNIQGSTGAAVPTGAIYLGGIAQTANPTNATGGNLTGVMVDKAGRVVVSPGNTRESVLNQTTTISASTAETTIVSAGTAGVFNDISSITITTTNSAAATLTLKDSTGGTTRAVYNYPNGAATPVSPLVIPFPVAMTQSAAAANWTLTASVNAGNFIVNVVYIKNL